VAGTTGTLTVARGGTGATDSGTARTNLGATTVGGNLFTLTNPSAVTFPRFNADNTVSALDAATFRTAIGAGAGSGTVTSVAASGGTTGLTFSGSPITTSGTLTLSGTLAVANGGTGATTSTGTGSVVLSTSPTLTGCVIDRTSTATVVVGGSSLITASDAVLRVTGQLNDNFGLWVSCGINTAKICSVVSVGSGSNGGVFNEAYGTSFSGTSFASVGANGGAVYKDSSGPLAVGTEGSAQLVFATNNTERARFLSTGQLGLATTTPTAVLDINSDTLRLRTARTPASATAAGNAGDICWDSSYIYVCVATNTWKRVAISTWP
jgi:hypothetical protein